VDGVATAKFAVLLEFQPFGGRLLVFGGAVQIVPGARFAFGAGTDQFNNIAHCVTPLFLVWVGQCSFAGRFLPGAYVYRIFKEESSVL
jgi:hypothetical protein